jgi:hypothetical protein
VELEEETQQAEGWVVMGGAEEPLTDEEHVSRTAHGGDTSLKISCRDCGSNHCTTGGTLITSCGDGLLLGHQIINTFFPQYV